MDYNTFNQPTEQDQILQLLANLQQTGSPAGAPKRSMSGSMGAVGGGGGNAISPGPSGVNTQWGRQAATNAMGFVDLLNKSGKAKSALPAETGNIGLAGATGGDMAAASAADAAAAGGSAMSY